MTEPEVTNLQESSISVIAGPSPAPPQVGGEMDALLLGRTGELVNVSPERRNWRGIFIALLVIAAVFSLIIFSIFLLSPEDEATRIRGRRMTLSDVIGKSLKWKPFNGTWASETDLVFRDPTGGLTILNLENFTTRILMSNSSFRQLNAGSFTVSPDQKYVLLVSETNVDGSRYHIYEVQTRNIFPLSPKENTPDAPRLQHVIWSPLNNLNANANNGKTNSPTPKQYSQGIAFVHQNDIYYKPKVQGDLVCRITKTGQLGVIYNGIPNWFYLNVPELKSNTISFSPDGQYMSFFSFNDSLVQEYRYTWIEGDSKYPKIKSIKYPKAGTNNPNVSIYVVNLAVLKYIFPQQIKLPEDLTHDNYIGGMTWPSPTDLSITVTDRNQTKAVTLICSAPNFVCHKIHAEVTVSDGWVLPAEIPVFSKKSSHTVKDLHTNVDKHNNNFDQNHGSDESQEFSIGGFLLKRLPVRDGEHGYYRHVVFISSIDNRAIPLTMGRFEVTKIIGWDEQNEIVYFMAAPEKKPGERHLYRINLKLNITSTNRTYITSSSPICLTCDNSPAKFKLINHNNNDTNLNDDNEDDDDNDDDDNRKTNCGYIAPRNCLYNEIHFNSDFSYYVQECLGPEAPSVYVVETETNNKVFVLHNGDSLRRKLYQLALPQIRVFSVEIRHGFHAQVRLFLPPGMKEDEEISFPLVLQIDSSPGSQLVSEKFQVDWNWYLSSKRSVIVAQIDARGSGYQGELLRTQIHGKLGTVEIQDQLGVLTYLRDNLKFIDPARIFAYGWGYGGFATAMTLIDDSQQVLQGAVAINPIASFGYHYSFFTERYIPMNGEYLRALQESDLTMKAGNIRGRNFMLVHGTVDTLVHQEHSLMLARSLIEQEVNFRHQVYPEENHNISGSLYHLYRTIEWYMDDCFGPLDDNEWDPTGIFSFKQ